MILVVTVSINNKKYADLANEILETNSTQHIENNVVTNTETIQNIHPQESSSPTV